MIARCKHVISKSRAGVDRLIADTALLLHVGASFDWSKIIVSLKIDVTCQLKLNASSLIVYLVPWRQESRRNKKLLSVHLLKVENEYLSSHP